MKNILFIFFAIGIAFPQSYPYWFLNTGKIHCSEVAIGYANIRFYRDSILTDALKNGRINWSKNKRLIVNGEEAFWSTEGGKFILWAQVDTYFDSAKTQTCVNKLEKKDFFTNGRIAIVLLGEKNCSIAPQDKRIINLKNKKAPKWITNIPSSPDFLYALGESPGYYYETSSWLNAEKRARIDLARQGNLTIKQLQKKNDREGQAITSEETSTVLHNIKFIARWVDIKRNIFFVLARIKIQK